MDFLQNLKVIIFDFDGTLFRLRVDWPRLKSDLGMMDGTGESLGEVIQRLIDEASPAIDIITRAELAAVKDRKLDDNVLAALLSLSKTHKLAVFTRNTRQAVEQLFDPTPLGAKLLIVGREDTRRLKPDPEGLHAIFKHFGCQPDEAVLVGDTYHDVEAAHAAGAYAFIVENTDLDYAPKGADRYLRSVSDLPLLLE